MQSELASQFTMQQTVLNQSQGIELGGDQDGFQFDENDGKDVPFSKLIMNQSYAPKASNRVIVITVCLSESITSDDEAYRTLLNALTNMHTTPGLLEEQDFVCYNIGSPLLKSLLKSDLQKHMPDFEEVYRDHSLFNEQLREQSTTFKVLQ